MADFTSPIAATYAAADPEPYFAFAARAGYVQPDNIVRYAAPVYERLAASAGGPVPILDVGCGYGAFGAIARHFGTARALYDAAEAGRLGQPGAFPKADGALGEAPIVGLDVSAPAARFAAAAGFVDEAVVEDLTAGPPSADAAALIGPCRLVVEVGAAWPAVMEVIPNLLDAFDVPPSILLSPRGDTPMDEAFDALDRAGFACTRLTDEPVRFRSFIDDAEREAVAARAGEPGVVRTPSDGEGYLAHVFLFEAR
jgi:SAM-dependent methyltransferase